MTGSPPAQDITIRYDLTGLGWAECIVTLGEQSVRLKASYLSDALASLAGLAIGALQGRQETIVCFQEEPGEYCWMMRPRDTRLIELRISTRLGLNPRDAWDGTQWQLVGNVDPHALAREVLAALDDVLARYGLDGYKERWHMHEFPSDMVEVLKGMMASTDTPSS